MFQEFELEELREGKRNPGDGLHVCMDWFSLSLPGNERTAASTAYLMFGPMDAFMETFSLRFVGRDEKARVRGFS